MVHTCKPSSQETEAGGLQWVRDQLHLQAKPCLTPQPFHKNSLTCVKLIFNTYLCTMCVPGAQGSQKNMFNVPGIGGYELPWRWWDLNPCSLKKQLVLLTTEPSLQPLLIFVVAVVVFIYFYIWLCLFIMYVGSRVCKSAVPMEASGVRFCDIPFGGCWIPNWGPLEEQYKTHNCWTISLLYSFEYMWPHTQSSPSPPFFFLPRN